MTHSNISAVSESVHKPAAVVEFGVKFIVTIKIMLPVSGARNIFLISLLLVSDRPNSSDVYCQTSMAN